MICTDYSPLKTLIVEPQALIAKALRSLVDQNAAVTVLRDNIELTLDDLRRFRPQLIIYGIDNSTDELSHIIELARSIVPDVRFVALSSYANLELMQRAMSAGADGFLLKDMPVAELDIVFRIISSGASYVDPRLAGKMFQRRFKAHSPEAMVAELTWRELEILRLVASGLANKEIGSKLTLSEKTIKNYMSRIFIKLDVSARTQAAVFAIRAGML